MTDKQQPEALRLANALEYCDASVARQAINELRRLHAELEALRAPHGQAPAQAVPAAVAGPVAVLKFERGTPGRQNEMPRVVSCNWMPDGEYEVYLAAAPTTQPSPAAQGDAELGRTAMRFVDRAGDVHPGIDDAETICAEFYKAMSDVIEKMPHVQRMQPSMSAPASQEGKSHDNT